MLAPVIHSTLAIPVIYAPYTTLKLLSATNGCYVHLMTSSVYPIRPRWQCSWG